MKSFAFRLESLIKLAKHNEDRAQQAVAQIQKEVLDVEKEIKKISQESEQTIEIIQKIQSNQLPFSDLEIQENYFHALESKKVEQEDLLLKAKARLGKAKFVLQKAYQEKKIIEKLKEKQYASWKEALRKEEAKVLDEIAVLKYARQEGLLQDD